MRLRTVLALVAVALTACGHASPAAVAPTTTAAPRPPVPVTRTISGTLTFTRGPCMIAGPSGWNVGDPVFVTDSAGKLLAHGTITVDRTAPGANNCLLDFRVPQVPEGASGYLIQVTDEDPVPFNWLQMLAGPHLVK